MRLILFKSLPTSSAAPGVSASQDDYREVRDNDRGLGQGSPLTCATTSHLSALASCLLIGRHDSILASDWRRAISPSATSPDEQLAMIILCLAPRVPPPGPLITCHPPQLLLWTNQRPVFRSRDHSRPISTCLRLNCCSGYQPAI